MIDFEAMSNPALLSQKVESSDYMQMIQDNGKKHELECWDELRKKYESVSELGYELSTYRFYWSCTLLGKERRTL